jgi:hypothetical protein
VILRRGAKRSSLGGVRPNILFVAGRSSCVQVLESAALQASLLPDICDTAGQAVERLVSQSYSALVVDLEAFGAENVLRMAHLLPPTERPVVFAMVSDRTPVATAYEFRANFVLYKPLQAEQVLRSLRAARGFMPLERRRSTRRSAGQTARSLVHFDLPGSAGYPAMLLDVNATGMSVQTTGAIPLRDTVPFRLQLPQGRLVRGAAEVLWTDSSGRAGLIFSRLAAQARQSIAAWLSSQENGQRVGQKTRRSRLRALSKRIIPSSASVQRFSPAPRRAHARLAFCLRVRRHAGTYLYFSGRSRFHDPRETDLACRGR